jgi:hypothetical protein
MKGTLPRTCVLVRSLLLVLCLCMPVFGQPIQDTMDQIVTRFYANLTPDELRSLNQGRVLKLLTDEERHTLATKYWSFEVNVPVVVSLMRSVDQAEVPYWIEEAGFKKTDGIVKNDVQTYEVWQKSFDAGRVELGINGFDRHLTVYFVCVGPQTPGATVEITNIFPKDTSVIEMKRGAWYLRDWNDLYIEELPDSLVGQQLLTTCRGRAWEAHLVGAFRTTPFPSSDKPDDVILTWSESPTATQTIQWRSSAEVTTGVVRYREANAPTVTWTETPATSALIEDRLLMNDRYTYRHTAVLRGLKPATSYVYSAGSHQNEAWTVNTTFTTAPDGDTPFSFIYLGDIHCWRGVEGLLRTIEERHAETAFYIIAGDVTNTGLYRDDWDIVFEHARGVFDRKPVMWSLGNHDEPNGLGAWLPLALVEYPRNGPQGVEPERNYSFRYGNTQFLVLDVDTDPEIQADWMESQLSSADARHRIGVYHFPLYSLGRDDEYEAIRRRWEAVFAKHHLDLMLHGHVHYYLRTAPMRNGGVAKSFDEGTVYITSLGLEGRKISRQIQTPDYVEKFMTGGPWYQKIDIDGDRIVYHAYDAAGTVCDELTIDRQ